MSSKLLFLFVALSSSAFAASSDDYLNSVCSPESFSGSVIPPCISVETIESECKPKGSSKDDFLQSAQCICGKGSTYFVDWLGCRKCLEVHGAFSPQQYNAYVLQASAASSTMCQGTPTADIAGVFASAQVQGTPTGATTTKDSFPSQSAVSLYYTPVGKQGPASGSGGSATTATGSSGLEPTASGSGSATETSGPSPSESGTGNSGSSGTKTTGGSGTTGTAASPSASTKNAADKTGHISTLGLTIIAIVAVAFV